MSKLLLIIRHAKADLPKDILSDFDRPLLPKGKSDAEELGSFLKENHIKPEMMICSPAKRTQETLSKLNKHLSIKKEDIIYEDKIYEASKKSLLEIINNLDNSKNLIALIGHNNGISDLAEYLTNKFITLPTSGALLIELPFESWKMTSGGTGKIILEYFRQKD